MKKLGNRGQKWLKSIHIFSASMWIGCAVTINILSIAMKAQTGEELYGIRATIDYIDFFILVPGAIATFVTALAYSIWTRWGWFKHRWIAVKWIICVFGIVFGTFWLGPWSSMLTQMSKEFGLEALSNLKFISIENYLLVFGTFQVTTLVFALVISTIKPWKKKSDTKT